MDGDFRIGAWLVQPSLNTVSRNGTTAHLEPKVMEVLVCLAVHANETIPKDQLLQTVWPDTFVSEGVLVRSISELRRVFDDDAKEPRVIQTIAKRGYRLVAPVTAGSAAESSSGVNPAEPTPTSELPASRRALAGWWLRAGVASCLGLTLATLVLVNPENVRARLLGRTGPPTIQSLAVLPLENLSGDPAQEYFADGMTEELITELSQLSALKVISRTSVMPYKKSSKSLPEIARELHVDAILEGSVLRSGDRVRITAQLIYARTDANLWARAYDHNLSDVLSMQRTVARAVADEIQVKMTASEKARMNEPRPANPAALEAYLKGEYHLGRFGTGFGKEERYKAIEYFQEATRLDPTFARAYSQLACAHTTNVLPPPGEYPAAKEALDKALAADPQLSDAHLFLARFKEFHDWEFAGAEQEFRRAIELNPSSAFAHDFYGDFLDNMGRRQEAEREEQLAQELDPGWDHLIDGFNHRGDYSQALVIARSNVAVHPNDGSWHAYLAYVYLHTGRYKEAIEELQQTATLYGYPEFARPLARAYSTSGYRGALRLWARDLERAQGNPASPTMVAEIYAHLGDKEAAFRWLERAYQERDGFLLTLRDPQWQSLRSDARFPDLVRRVGLPQ